jgi:hypothetical protein
MKANSVEATPARGRRRMGAWSPLLLDRRRMRRPDLLPVVPEIETDKQR